jgi:hypothetical protein
MEFEFDQKKSALNKKSMELILSKGKILNAPEFISFNSYFYCDSPPDTSYFLQEKYGAPGPSDGCGYNQPVIQSDIHSFDIDTSFQWNQLALVW